MPVTSTLPEISVVIATRNRGALLQVMLASLDAALADTGCRVQTVVVDSASTDSTPDIIAAWATAQPARLALRLDQPGKARALNLGLRHVSAPLIAFTDDDVEVDPRWLTHLKSFFDEHPGYAAATGRVRTPPSVTEVSRLQRVALFSTLPLFDRGDSVQECKHLYGCNMAIRRPALEQVGPFNEKLGPGASGLHEDGDLARRVIERGLRIAYMPDVVVYHAVEDDRLTFAFFREMHRRDARSRFVLNPHRSRLNVLGHWLGSAAGVAAWALLLNRRRTMKALARLLSHTEMLRLVGSRPRPS